MHAAHNGEAVATSLEYHIFLDLVFTRLAPNDFSRKHIVDRLVHLLISENFICRKYLIPLQHLL